MCFLRDLPVQDAFETYKLALPFKKDIIIGIGLDSAEVGFPPTLFKDLFLQAKKDGFKLCCHAGEEGPSDFIKDAVEILGCERIDHGIYITKDE